MIMMHEAQPIMIHESSVCGRVYHSIPAISLRLSQHAQDPVAVPLRVSGNQTAAWPGRGWAWHVTLLGRKCTFVRENPTGGTSRKLGILFDKNCSRSAAACASVHNSETATANLIGGLRRQTRTMALSVLTQSTLGFFGSKAAPPPPSSVMDQIVEVFDNLKATVVTMIEDAAVKNDIPVEQMFYVAYGVAGMVLMLIIARIQSNKRIVATCELAVAGKPCGSGTVISPQRAPSLSHIDRRPSAKQFVPEKASKVSGKVTLTQVHGVTTIEYKVVGLEPGPHGFHIHETADFSNGCVSAGVSVRRVCAAQHGAMHRRVCAHSVELPPTGCRCRAARRLVPFLPPLTGPPPPCMPPVRSLAALLFAASLSPARRSSAPSARPLDAGSLQSVWQIARRAQRHGAPRG